jgi:transposase
MSPFAFLDLPALVRETAKAMRRFGLPDETAVVSCYEAGRDGFWLHRWLTSHGIANVIVGSASIEVNRRKQRAKSDRLDAAKLVSMLLRSLGRSLVPGVAFPEPIFESLWVTFFESLKECIVNCL